MFQVFVFNDKKTINKWTWYSCKQSALHSLWKAFSCSGSLGPSSVHVAGSSVQNCALLFCYAASNGDFLTDVSGQSIESLLDSGRRDRQVVPKRRQEITTTRCAITQKSPNFSYFAAEAWNRAFPPLSSDEILWYVTPFHQLLHLLH